MARTHLAFRRLREPVKQAAEELFATKPWRLENDSDRMTAGQAFLDAVSDSYGVLHAELSLVRSYGSSDFRYSPAVYSADSLADEPTLDRLPQIIMQGWSILTLMRATRAHVLAQEGDTQHPSDPLGWAHSLFYSVRPKMYRARAREGRMAQVSARDTFSEESWNKLTDAGFTIGDRLIGTPEAWGRVLGFEVASQRPMLTDIDQLPDEDEYDSELSDEELAELFGETPHAEDSDDDSPFSDEAVASEEPSAPDAIETTDLDSLNRDALRKLAAAIELPGRGSMNAPELREALRSRVSQ